MGEAAVCRTRRSRKPQNFFKEQACCFLCSPSAWCPQARPQHPGEFVDLYVLQKCPASKHIIGSKDHASIQMNVAEVDKVTGRFNGQFKTYAICGAIRRMGESDDSVLRLDKVDGIVSKN
ncbi:40S ribosomal protein S21-like [Echinops telfairi]|uniref:40S ribosomal protein S21-like n=1 Tax=Echinops telfairi TaxID=9371 RepID=A0ABM0J2C6_ECHTE|nr:40S ribosomal protein S21-like [Echinops telfairi]